MARNNVNKFINHPKKALYLISYPVALAMLVQVLYDVIDTVFIGRLGAEELAAITFAFPLFFILFALNSGLGAGMGSKISRLLGQKNRRDAENTAMHGVIFSVVLAAILLALGFYILTPLFEMFGAKDRVLSLAIGYASMLFFGFFFMFTASAFSSIFSSQGDTRTDMIIQVVALLINLVLDPILIFGFDMGIRGAALGTVIGYAIAVMLYFYYINKKSYLKLRWASFRFSKDITWEIISVGFPTVIMVLILSVYIIFINRFMAHFGVEYVATFGLVSIVESIVIIPLAALSVSMLTLSGMFHGAKKYDKLIKISWYSIKSTLVITSIIGALIFLGSRWVFYIFTSDPEIIALSASFMRFDVFTFPLMGIVMIVSRIMQGLGKGLPGLILQVVRVFIVAVPLAYIFVFPLDLNYLSVAVAMILGGAVATIISLIWLKIELNKY